MTLAEAFEAMEKEGHIGTFDGQDYYVSMGVLMRMPYGVLASLTYDMVVGVWETREQVEI